MPASKPLAALLASVWNALGAPVRRRLTWLIHAKFAHGVSGLILDPQGRVLLLKHRFWVNQPWGLPSGMARHGESLAATLKREMIEETGLPVTPRKLLRLGTKSHGYSQFYLLADCAGEPRVVSSEIMEARFYTPADLPENLLPSHRALIQEYMEKGTLPGIDLEN
jgi:ADP-ribose pyrophosphatase YjhB (NUDIX family)